MESKICTECKSFPRTSEACPVMDGAICLLAKEITQKERWNLLNASSIKQARVERASRSSRKNVFKRGAGILNL